MTMRRLALSLTFACFSVLLSLLATPAFAASVKAEKTTLEEDPEAHNWKLKLVLDYGKTPDRDVIPMSFSFKQTATYERSLNDETGDKPVMRTVAMQNQVPNNSEQEVGFSDPGTGKRFPITKFPITIRRKDDFEAGEYELTIKVVGGQTLGTVRLQLKGDNKLIDRRSLNFSGTVAAPKKKADEGKGAVPEAKGGAAEDQGPDLSSIPDAPKSDRPASSADDHAPPAVAPKQGGCGCELAGTSESGPTAVVLALGFGLAVALRRRR
jgi:MYXO-CTERM domain-containing protein